ncbi:unnamed protein product, partial [Rotaria magnacalcarata]
YLKHRSGYVSSRSRSRSRSPITYSDSASALSTYRPGHACATPLTTCAGFTDVPTSTMYDRNSTQEQMLTYQYEEELAVDVLQETNEKKSDGNLFTPKLAH